MVGVRGWSGIIPSLWDSSHMHWRPNTYTKAAAVEESARIPRNKIRVIILVCVGVPVVCVWCVGAKLMRIWPCVCVLTWNRGVERA